MHYQSLGFVDRFLLLKDLIGFLKMVAVFGTLTDMKKCAMVAIEIL